MSYSSLNRSEEEEVQIDPIISQAFQKWWHNLSIFNFWLSSLVILSYFLSKNVFVSYYFPLQLSFWLIFLLTLSVDKFFASLIQSLVTSLDNSSVNIRQRASIWMMWTFSLILVYKVGWFSLNFDPGTVLFLSYLPAVWLFKIPRTLNGLLALFILSFIPILLIGNYEKTAEIFAVIVYFLLVVATIEGFLELKGTDEN